MTFHYKQKFAFLERHNPVIWYYGMGATVALRYHNRDGSMSPATWEEMGDNRDDFYDKVSLCTLTSAARQHVERQNMFADCMCTKRNLQPS